MPLLSHYPYPPQAITVLIFSQIGCQSLILEVKRRVDLLSLLGLQNVSEEACSWSIVVELVMGTNNSRPVTLVTPPSCSPESPLLTPCLGRHTCTHTHAHGCALTHIHFWLAHFPGAFL